MSNPQHEPTMEEILASIRKIISEDSPEAAAPVALAPAPQMDEVLELTHEVAPEPEPVPAPIPEPEHDLVFESFEPAVPADYDNGIFSDHTRKAMEDTFASIPAMPPEPAPQPHSAPSMVRPPTDGATLESVFERAVSQSFEPVLRKYLSDNSCAVIEGMKPVIREWMDEHFPALLEGAVRAEAERVARSHVKR